MFRKITLIATAALITAGLSTGFTAGLAAANGDKAASAIQEEDPAKKGLELLQAGDNDGAIDYLKQAVELDPANVEARVTLAGYYLNAPSIAGGSKKKAREQAEEIVKYDEVRGNWLLARVLIKDEKYDEAITRIEACIAADPEDADYRYQLAMVYQGMERWDETFAQLEAILDIDPDAAGALYQVGRTAAMCGENTDRGIECLERYLTIEVLPGYPGYDGAHWRLGMIYEHRGEQALAKEHFETAVELNPEDENYRKSLNELASK